MAHIFSFINYEKSFFFANTFLLFVMGKNHITSTNRYYSFDTEPNNTKCVQCYCKVKGGV